MSRASAADTTQPAISVGDTSRSPGIADRADGWLGWLCPTEGASRMALTYALWGALHLPLLIAVGAKATEWKVYGVFIGAGVLSWTVAAQLRADCHFRGRPRLMPCAAALVGAVMAAVLTPLSLLAAAGVSLVTLALLRRGFFDETLGQMAMAGWLPLLLAVPLPMGWLEAMVAVKGNIELPMIAAMLSQALSPLAVHVNETRLEMVLPGEGLVGVLGYARQCAGISTFRVAIVLAACASNKHRHPLGLLPLMVVTGAVIAVVCNIVRILLSAVLGAGYSSFWLSGSGHELIGMLMLFPIIGALIFTAKRLVLEDGDSSSTGSKKAHCGTRGGTP